MNGMIEIVSYNWDSSRIADSLAWKPNKKYDFIVLEASVNLL